MKNSKLVIVGLISLGLGYYFGMKKGKKEGNREIMKRFANMDDKPRRSA